MCAAAYFAVAVMSSTRAWVDSEETLLTALADELDVLQGQSVETTSLLIHPDALQVFTDCYHFLQRADALHRRNGKVGVYQIGVPDRWVSTRSPYQITSFHPDYQFAATSIHAAENYSNRSLFPMLYLIPAANRQLALAFYPDTAEIPRRNIAILRRMG